MTMPALRVALYSLREALAFFTTLPLPAATPRRETDLRPALLALPAVGLVLGLLLLAANALLQQLPDLVRGACLTALWLVLTGALHFDGLCDTADALFSARARDERLRIAADPHLGSYALATGASTLLLKFAALSQGLHGAWLVTVPILARALIPPIAALYPNHAASRLGRAAKPTPISAIASAALALLGALVFTALTGQLPRALLMVGVATALPFALATFVQRRFGGLGGDAFGATIETLETALLIVAAVAL